MSHTNAYAEVHPPSAVQCAASGHFTRAAALGGCAEVLLARGNVLEVWSVGRRADAAAALQCEASFTLQAHIESLAVLRRRSGASRSQRDALLVATREAKLSVLEWDPLSRGLRTSSLHRWEGRLEGGAAGGAALTLGTETAVAAKGPRVLTDPEGRAAAVLLGGGGEVAVLPAVRADRRRAARGTARVSRPSLPRSQAGSGLAGDDDIGAARGSRGAAALCGGFLLDLRGRGVRSVRDAVFLHGYAEPVLLLLHEVSPTWAGRLALRHDTCALAAFSLSLATGRATRIWGDSSLPYDLTALAAVPAPCGGALLFGASFLLYRGQGAAPVSLALQAHALGSPDVPQGELGDDGRPLAPPSGAASVNPAPQVAAHATLSPLECGLEGAKAAFTPHGDALLATQQGGLLALAVRTAGRCVVALELARMAGEASPPQPCALLHLDGALLLAASRCGDAALHEYRYAAPRAATLALEAPPPKRKRTLAQQAQPDEAPPPAAAAAKEEEEEEDEDALLYGSGAAAKGGGGGAGPAQQQQQPQQESESAAPSCAPGGTYSLLLRDSLPCVAPCCDGAVGEAPVGGESGAEPGASRAELLLGTGSGTCGALVALHRGVTLDLVAAVPLPGVRGAWALHARKPGAPLSLAQQQADAAAAQPGGARVHDYLLLSTRGATMVLDASSSEELAEVSDRAEFETGQPTLAAGALFGGARLAQVHPGGVRLCAGLVKAQEVALAALQPPPPPGVTLAAADVAHPHVLLRLSDGSLRLLAGNPATNRLEALPLRAPSPGLGLGGARFSAAQLHEDLPGGGALAAALGAGAAGVQHFLVGATQSGRLEVYALPSQACLFSAAGLAAGHCLLCASPAAAAQVGGVDGLLPPAEVSLPQPPAVTDVLLGAFPWNGAHEAPLLCCVRADGEVFAYRGFAAPAHVTAGVRQREGAAAASELRFVRYALALAPPPPGAPPPPPGELEEAPRRLVALVGCRGGCGAPGSVSGVLALGRTPHLLVCSRGSVRAHPLSLPPGCAGVAAATPFHNVNCPHGLVLATAAAQGAALRIATLPAGLELQGAWPCTRTRLGVTPVALAYCAEARCYAVALQLRRSFRPRAVEQGDMHGATAAALAAAAAERAGGLEEAQEVRLLAPGSLATAWCLPLDPGEAVLALCPLPLRNAATGEVLPVLAVGTAFLCGEDAPCRGRLLLLSLAWQRDAGGAITRSARVLVERSYKAAVTCVAALEGMHKGYLLMCVGTKLGVYAWNGGVDLGCIAFYDTPNFSVGLATVKNFVLLGDVHKGLFFLRWKDSPTEKLLAQLAKTFERLDFAAGELLMDGNTLSLLGCDTLGVLHLYSFAPGAVEAWMGQKLLPRARFHAGRGVTRALRLRAPGAHAQVRSGVLLTTLEGALCAVTPLDEPAFEPLRALAAAMTLALPHDAGLNPEAQRAARERQGRVGKQPCAGTLADCTLLQRFLDAPWGAQHALAHAAGQSRAALVSAIRDAQAGSAWFI